MEYMNGNEVVIQVKLKKKQLIVSAKGFQITYFSYSVNLFCRNVSLTYRDLLEISNPDLKI